MKTLINRVTAIKAAGLVAVEKVEAENCYPTNVVGHNGECQGDEDTEHSASIALDDGRVLTVYYYTTNEQDQAIADADGDGSVIDWQIAGYEIN